METINVCYALGSGMNNCNKCEETASAFKRKSTANLPYAQIY